MAREWFPPAATAVMLLKVWVVVSEGLTLNTTLTGVSTPLELLLFPNWPEKFAPQAWTVLLLKNARVWAEPAEIPFSPVKGRPFSRTATGVLLVVVTPFPSCPEPLYPQAMAVLFLKATLWALKIVTAVTGMVEVVVPLPPQAVRKAARAETRDNL